MHMLMPYVQPDLSHGARARIYVCANHEQQLYYFLETIYRRRHQGITRYVLPGIKIGNCGWFLRRLREVISSQ